MARASSPQADDGSPAEPEQTRLLDLTHPVAMDLGAGALILRPDKLPASLEQGSRNHASVMVSQPRPGPPTELEVALIAAGLPGRELATALADQSPVDSTGRAFMILGRRVVIDDPTTDLRSLLRRWAQAHPWGRPTAPAEVEDESITDTGALPPPLPHTVESRARIRAGSRGVDIDVIVGAAQETTPSLPSLLHHHVAYWRELKQWHRQQSLCRQRRYLPRMAVVGLDPRAQSWCDDALGTEASKAMAAVGAWGAAGEGDGAGDPETGGGQLSPARARRAAGQLTVALSPAAASSPVRDDGWWAGSVDGSTPAQDGEQSTTGSEGADEAAAGPTRKRGRDHGGGLPRLRSRLAE